MQDKKKETPNWNPPSPPWNPEPDPLALKATPEPEPVDEGIHVTLAEKVLSALPEAEGNLVASDEEVIEAPGLDTYTVICPTGITINGKVYAAGPHSVDEDTYETLSNLDKPYQ